MKGRDSTRLKETESLISKTELRQHEPDIADRWVQVQGNPRCFRGPIVSKLQALTMRASVRPHFLIPPPRLPPPNLL